ncbi:hypothetical protein DNTS_010807 [Danionella cerebrum]|uniref:Uncharacterized protein n=1 Tax=Danionella cerebrum TaxID=2873325 RepID=A0A553QHJ2_9TELE|nr:hypothetical protein DNTS_010807 [Danionella translucida]
MLTRKLKQTSMFAEEEWTHSPSSQDGSSQTVKVSPALLKRKAVNKQSLLRTLQSLGSTPDWEILEPKEDCDEERKTLSPVKKTKKKKCRKRKRKSNTADEEKELDEVAPETPVKKTKITQPVKKSGEKNNEGMS